VDSALFRVRQFTGAALAASAELRLAEFHGGRWIIEAIAAVGLFAPS